MVSALDPRRTFLELVDPRELPADLVENITRFRFQGTSSKVNFALDGLPEYPALPGRGDQYRGFMNIGPSMDYLERAYDDAKYGWYSQRPYIDCAIQSTIDPDMAPPGKHVMSSFIQYTPYKLRESDWDTERENLGDTVQATLESFFPGFGKLVLQREVVTPLDIERTVGLSEGNIFAGEFLAPQMFFFRPAPGWSQYRTPIDGYYQCGSGTHPGGCVIGAPGQARGRTDPEGPRQGLIARRARAHAAPAVRGSGSVYWATPERPQPPGTYGLRRERHHGRRPGQGLPVPQERGPRARRRRPRGPRRHDPRPARPERRRQDDDGPDPRDAAQAGCRPRDRGRASTSSSRPSSSARSSACPASTRPSTRT